ncbi:MAG TPA: hypothetical protein V6D27_04615 [Vampirovibrionales bacterium]
MRASFPTGARLIPLWRSQPLQPRGGFPANGSGYPEPNGWHFGWDISTHLVYAEIKETATSDRTRADGRYWTLGQEGGEFVIAKDGGI